MRLVQSLRVPRLRVPSPGSGTWALAKSPCRGRHTGPAWIWHLGTMSRQPGRVFPPAGASAGSVRLRAQAVVGRDRVFEPGEVLIEDGRCVAVRPSRSGSALPAILIPGLVDLQVNGLEEMDVVDAQESTWTKLDMALLKTGVTTWCPAVATLPAGAIEAALGAIGSLAMNRPVVGGMQLRPGIAGVHLEGPFLGEKSGAHRPEWIREIDLRWLGALPGFVAAMTLAPECPGALDATALLASRGALVALGHSNATYEQAVAAIEAGARLVTHLGNAMGPLHHRSPGLIGAALCDDRVAVSLIADPHHLHPAMIDLAFRSKGPDGVVLISDSVATTPARVGGSARFVEGKLRGSRNGLSHALAFSVLKAGISLPRACNAASSLPAHLLGFEDRGILEPGRRADIVALDPHLLLPVATWIAGELAYCSGAVPQ